jgi:hypothetical protein
MAGPFTTSHRGPQRTIGGKTTRHTEKNDALSRNQNFKAPPTPRGLDHSEDTQGGEGESGGGTNTHGNHHRERKGLGPIRTRRNQQSKRDPEDVK